MQLSDSLVAHGQQHGIEGDWEGALAAAESALQVDRKSFPASLLKAEAAARTGQIEIMEKCFHDLKILSNSSPVIADEIRRISQLSEANSSNNQNNIHPASKNVTSVKANFPELGENMIFLLGLPRSGTTLLQRLLGAHSQIHTVAEPWIMLHLSYALKRDGIEAEYDSTLSRQGLDDFLMELPEGENTYIKAIRHMALELYSQSLREPSKSRFLDKTPRYYYIIPELKRIFPRAKFVFLLRNPLAILASVLRSWFSGDANALRSNKYNYRDLFEGPSYLLRGMDELGKDAIVLKYEDLVSVPEETMKSLIRLLELPYEGDVLSYANQGKFKGRFGDQIGINKHDAPVTDSIEKWMDDLLDQESNKLAREYVEHLGAANLERMGYSYTRLKQDLDRLAVKGILQGNTDPVTASPALRNEMAATLCEEGENHYANGDFDAAAAAFLKAARIAHSSPRAFNNIAVMLWGDGDRGMAGSYAAKALSVCSDDKTTVLNFGDMMEAMEQLSAARAAYLNYMMAHPEDMEITQRYLALPETQIAATATSAPAQDSLKVTPENFHEFTYSRRSHFNNLKRHESQQNENIDDCNLKVYQDMLAYNFVLDNFPEGSRLLDIGGGDSRIIRWLKDRYEFWNLDKLEGLGNGLTGLENTSGFRLVQDYIGNFSKELPDGYFDGILSISTLEHVPEDDHTLKAICDDMDRLLKPGGISMHCFDVIVKQSDFWIHRLVDYFHRHEPVLNPRIPEWKMRIDPDLWGMTKQGYERVWMPVTKVSYEKFGMPISYNVLWVKPEK